MEQTPNSPAPHFDLIVIGAGPAGCEASVAAANSGARTLCLTINLDTIALHPASPVLAGGADDPRRRLLEEFQNMGGVLPRLLDVPGLTRNDSAGRLVIERRRLGLAYKERLEATTGVATRQALVTSLFSSGDRWTVATKLGECFSAACIIVATGTYMAGVVEEAGVRFPGGRRGEIPANALAQCLQDMGVKLERADATSYPRLDARTVASTYPQAGALPSDEENLDELYGMEIDLEGNRAGALAQLRTATGFAKAWVNRSGFVVSHLILAAGQVSPDLESCDHGGLYFTGRVSGSRNYSEAAVLGLIAGKLAGARSRGIEPDKLINGNKYVSALRDAVAHQTIRPVTIRVPPPAN